MLKKIAIALGGIGLVVLGSLYLKAQTDQSSYVINDRQTMNLLIGSQKITVEVVNTPESITQGLSGRSEIGNDGMLFLFSEKRTPQFWMKEMQFDLDLIWISNNQVIGISAQVPKPSPNTPLEKLPHYLPPKPVDSVLEVPSGKASEWGIKPGDPVVITP